MREQNPRAARRLDEANAAFAPTPGEQAAAWTRLQARWNGVPDPGPRRRASRVGLGFLVGAGALASLGAILWLVIPRGPAGEAAPPIAAREPLAVPASPGPSAATRAEPPALPDRPGPAAQTEAAPIAPERPPTPVALRPGRSVLADGVHARLAPRGAATLREGSKPFPSIVSLHHGRLDIAIDPARDAGAARGVAPATPAAAPRLEIQVAAYRIAADPGQFSVSTRGGRVDVVVKRGKLAVWSSRRLLATVVAGERWTNLAASDRVLAVDGAAEAIGGETAGGAIAGPGAESPAPAEATHAPAATAPAPGPDCARLTRQGAIDPALDCFAREAAQPGLAGELALIELARIRRDVKGDLAGAERALAEHHRRFPHGALAAEAAGSRVELLLRLGRVDEALVESERMAGSEAIFWRAVCLTKLGRKTDAAQALDDYLARLDGKRRAEAAHMRAELRP